MAVNKVCTTLHFAKRPQVTGGRDSSSETSWTPNTDVYLADKGLVIKVELSGIRREDLVLTVEGNQLRISGQRRDCCRAAKCKFMLMEINYWPFESVIELPSGYDLSSAKAIYQNGFLRVDVPVAAATQAQPFSVPVEAAES